MKKLIFPLVCLCSLHVATFSQNVLTEDFLFGPVDSLENSNDWYRSGVDLPYNIKVVAPGLSYAGYVGSNMGNACQLVNAGNGDVVIKNLSTPITTGAAYLSFMIQVDSLPSTLTEGLCISFNPNTGGTNLNTSLMVKRLSDLTFQLGVQKEIGKTVSYAGNTLDRGKTYLAVLKYSIINGAANDSSRLYLFSQGVPTVEPSAPSAGTIDGGDYTGQGSVVLSNNYAQDGLKGCNIKLDGIRVGNSWATSVLSILSSVSDEKMEVPITHTNFPNPFDQSTTIRYQIPDKGLVRIEVLDATGRLVAGLLNEVQEEGTHAVNWEASLLPPGLYVYSIYFNGAVVSGPMFRQL